MREMIAEVGSPNKHEIKFESSCFIQYRIDGLEIQKQYNYIFSYEGNTARKSQTTGLNYFNYSRTYNFLHNQKAS